jgi:hypothetical protein
VNREAEPAENEGKQKNEQDDTHEPISFFLMASALTGPGYPVIGDPHQIRA